MAQKYNCRLMLEIKTAEALQQSVEYLKRIESPPNPSVQNILPPVTTDSTYDERINLFFSLFKGRDDVYARRWESRDGKKSGYNPACRNDEVRGICDKFNIKRNE